MAASPNPRNSKATNARRTTAKQRRHQHVLDVSVRTTQVVRQRQHKFLSLTAKLLLALGISACLYFGIRRGIALLLIKNPEYNLAEINVETDGALSPAVVLAAADLHKGSNIFLVNLNRAQARVETLPQVEKVQVTRQLPNRVTIQVNERKPIALVAPEHTTANRDNVMSAPDAYLIDAHSILLPVAKSNTSDIYLPIIRNYAGPRSSGQEAEGEEIKAALDLLHAQQDSMIAARFHIEEIDLAKHFGLQVTDRNGLQVLFGLDDPESQLKRLDVALQVLDQAGPKPQTINLLVQKNVPVTYVTEPVLAPAPPAASPATPPNPPTPLGKSTVSAKSSPAKTGKVKEKGHSKTKVMESQHTPNSKKKLQPFGGAGH